MAKKAKDLNYDFVQKAPKNPMGHGDFANLLKGVVIKPFDTGASYRGGIMNNPATGVDFTSGVDENGCR